jgi:hypothetical protein
MLWLLGLGAAAIAGGPAAGAEEFEAISSTASPDYVRSRLPDGSFEPETYSFGKGGLWSGPLNDKSIDRMDFMDVARTIAGPLAAQRYVPSHDPSRTRLLIMVYWGTTHAPEHASSTGEYELAMDEVAHILDYGKQPVRTPGPGGTTLVSVRSGMTLTLSNAELDALLPVEAENRMRDNQDRRTAALLGYGSWWNKYSGIDHAGTAIAGRWQDMIDELEEYRYFVILMAYDFQVLWKQKKHRLLWETRYSISEHHSEFDKQLAAMTVDASRYFGQNTGGLVHTSEPVGRVEIGEVKSLGVVPEK